MLSTSETEALYERLAEAVDRARAGAETQDGAPASQKAMAARETLFLAKLAFAALRHVPAEEGERLVALCLKDLDPPRY
jgi:hypothetical protein